MFVNSLLFKYEDYLDMRGSEKKFTLVLIFRLHDDNILQPIGSHKFNTDNDNDNDYCGKHI